MKKEVYSFLHRGYFPKELPNPFNSYLFAVNYEDVNNEWVRIKCNPENYIPKSEGETEDDYKKRLKIFKRPVSSPSVFSFLKGKYGRRDLAILNPINFLELVLCIDSNMHEIQTFINNSKYTNSKPTYEIDIDKRCYTPSSRSLQSYIKTKLECGRNSKIEVKIDIAKFYESIYTHSITWALIGKDKAKDIWRGNGNKKVASPSTNEEKLYNLGMDLDVLIESCQDRQTHGIPTGPDSSFIVGEIIATYLDMEVKKHFPNLKGCRYYDDYSFFVSKDDDAKKVIEILQHAMLVLGLAINESKLEIRESFNRIQEDYKCEISSCKLENKNVKNILINYFNILWRLCENCPNSTSTIIKYGLAPLSNRIPNIDLKTLSLFESLLYKTALLEPACLYDVASILDKKGLTPSSDKLLELCRSIISYHAPLHHHYEISWCLWMVKKYDLKLEKTDIIQIFDMQDVICTLMVLDFLNNNMAANVLKQGHEIISKIEKIERDLSPSSLFNEYWLLAYEGIFHGWLNRQDIIDGNPFFKCLSDKGIHFYDTSNSADYHSYDYIESLVEDIYPKPLRKDAKDIKNNILRNVYTRLKEEFDEDEDVDLKSLFEEYSDDLNLENKLFNDILSHLFRDEDVDKERYEDELVKKLTELFSY